MKYFIVFPEKLYLECRNFLLRDLYNEQFGYLLAGVNQVTDQYVKLLVHTFLPAKNHDDLEYQTTGGICPSPNFQMGVYSKCKKEGHHLIDMHSHPFDTSGYVQFSGIDNRYEFGNGREGVFGFTAMWNPGMYHASIVFGQNSLDARIYCSEIGRAVPIDEIRILRSIIPTSALLLSNQQRATLIHTRKETPLQTTEFPNEINVREKKKKNDFWRRVWKWLLQQL